MGEWRSVVEADRVDAITAGLTSMRLVLTQPFVMLCWGAAITVLVVAAMVPGIDRGKVTRRKVVKGEAPRLRAASSRLGSIACSER